MEYLFKIYLQNSVCISAVCTLMLAASPLLSRRYSAKCRLYLWLAIMTALIIPVRIKIPLKVPRALITVLPVHNAGSASAAFNGQSAVFCSGPDLWRAAAFIWFTGILIFLLFHLGSHIRFVTAVKRWSSEADSARREQFGHVICELGIKRGISLKSCACIGTPMMLGILRPAVLLPQWRIAEDELYFILKHELVHFKRRDILKKALVLIALSVNWFNPIIYLSVRQLLSLCEISCDEEVLMGVGKKDRVKYGEAIIGAIRKDSFRRTALSANFYSGSKDIKKRVYAIMNTGKKRFSVFAVAAVLTIAFCGFSSIAAENKSVITEKPKITVVLNTAKNAASSKVSRHSDKGPVLISSSRKAGSAYKKNIIVARHTNGKSGKPILVYSSDIIISKRNNP